MQEFVNKSRELEKEVLLLKEERKRTEEAYQVRATNA